MLNEFQVPKRKDIKITKEMIDACSEKILISHKYKFIFIHGPKTGGTSIRNSLRFCFEDFDKRKGKFRVIDNKDIKKYGLKGKKCHAFHLPLSEQKKMVPKEIWDSYFKFTFVRNPWDRMVSFYTFKKNKKKKNFLEYDNSYDMSFKNFCLNYKECLSDYYLDEEGEIGVNFIGKLENIENDFKEVCKKIGIMGDVKLGYGNKTRHKHYSRYYDQFLQDLIAKKDKKIIDLFNYKFEGESKSSFFDKIKYSYSKIMKNYNLRSFIARRQSKKGKINFNENDLKRIEYYLGSIPEEEILKRKYSEDTEKLSGIDLIDTELYKKFGKFENNRRERYGLPLFKLLSEIGKTKNFFFWQPGDVGKNPPDEYYISKIRTKNQKKVTILNFTPKRHWNYVYNKPKDIDFDKKIDAIIWRGANTGNDTKPGSRFTLVKKYSDKRPDIDVGFSKFPKERFFEEYGKYLKEKLSPEEMLKYKYILSVEGNDKDSGINWKLNSNSLVLMPKPTKYSWLMEEKLIPGTHYILLKDDFSDLEEKLEWCRNHQEECKEIIKNANQYMSQFMDKVKEREIEREVLRRYFGEIVPDLGEDGRELPKKLIS